MIERQYQWTDVSGVRWRKRLPHETWLADTVSELADRTIDSVGLECGLYVIGTLAKRSTDDGLFRVLDTVPLGKEYLLATITRKMAHGRNTVHQKDWYKEIITDVVTGEFLPTEVLNIPATK